MSTDDLPLGHAGTATIVRLMTIEEVAAELRVSVPTVRWLRQEGRFASAVKVGRRLMWDLREVSAWIDNNVK